MTSDPRHTTPTWDPNEPTTLRRRGIVLGSFGAVAAAWYIGWLIQPVRVGTWWLYFPLIAAEVFNMTQAVGFWWTVSSARTAPTPAAPAIGYAETDVLIAVYDEPINVIEPTVAAATRLRGGTINVVLCDDGSREELRVLAESYGVRYIARESSAGAKAGNLNNALAATGAPFVAVLDSDHVPEPHFLETTLAYFDDADVAFVQSPQYYANHPSTDLAGAAWEQQSLFFGPIARGKDGLGAMFCAGTNVVFRREPLESVGGYPEGSVTEDFELSVQLHERGWRTRYVPEVLVKGLGPESYSAYVGQQDRWARGCLAAIPTTLRARLPWHLKAQYLLSSSFFLTGWTFLVYMSLPIIRLLTGHQPIARGEADLFLVHFAPYFGLALLTVSIAGVSGYTFRAYAVMFANFWVHIRASLAVLLGVGGGFTVTSKEGTAGPEPGAVLPGLALILVLAGVSLWALASSVDPSTLNNVGFALLHLVVLVRGVLPALRSAVVTGQPAASEQMSAGTTSLSTEA